MHRWREARELRQALRNNRGPLRIVIGASGSAYAGWIATEYPVVDVADARSLARFFSPASVSAILAEHVWEHLTPRQAEDAARNCYALLAPRGYLRIAVPDGAHPDPAYVEYARPGGSGPGSEDHKVLYTHDTLCGLLKSAGFETQLLEWFDEQRRFHYVEWNPDSGRVSRSSRFDERNTANPTAYTSLIVDAVRRK
jgi:predicted SAM-dependent methyltransferase